MSATERLGVLWGLQAHVDPHLLLGGQHLGLLPLGSHHRLVRHILNKMFFRMLYLPSTFSVPIRNKGYSKPKKLLPLREKLCWKLFSFWGWKCGRPVRKTSSMWLISLGRRPTVLLSHGAYFLGGVLTLIFPNFTLLLFFRCNFLSNFYLTTPAGFWLAVLITLSPICPTS